MTARQKALSYVRQALDERKKPPCPFNKHRTAYDLLSAAYFTLVSARDQRSPYGKLIGCIRKRWMTEDAERCYPTERVLHRRGLMTEEQRERYETNCRWKKPYMGTPFVPKTTRDHELQRMANATLQVPNHN